nr:acyl-CoA thioesterase [Novosphingopyxis sp. YJ-S2-01]
MPEWIDRNRHMNMARYLGLFDEACDALLSRSEIIEAGNDLTVVAGRVQMAHRRELFEGEHWQVWSGLASVTEKSIVFVHRLLRENKVCATCDIYSAPFSMAKRSRTTIDCEQVRRLLKLVVPGIRDPFALSIEGDA